MTKRTADTTMPKKEVSKKVYEERLSVINGLGKPIPDWFIEEIRVDLKEWSEKRSSLRFKDFLLEKRITWKVFCDLKARYAPLQQEYEWALDSIASRRELGAITGKLTPIAIRMMPRYDSEWLENEEKLAAIKRLSQVEGSHETKIMVMLPEVPNSPLVPERKVDE